MPLPSGEIHVWFHGVDLPAGGIEDLARTLTPAELARANRYHFDADRRRSIVARASLRLHLSRYCGLGPGDIVVRSDEGAKPDAPATGIHFNVSHAGDLVGLAFSADCSVGFDVERVRTIGDGLGIAKRFFSPAEQQLVAAAVDRDDVFFRLWTAKEAIVKGTGKGLSSRLDAFTVPLDVTTLTPIRTELTDYEDWCVAAVEPPRGGYRAAVAARHLAARIRVTPVEPR